MTRDGLQLGLQHWDAQKPEAVIVALHGMSDYANAFAAAGEYWAKQGIATYAYDQRGFGRSPYSGLWAGADILRNDLYDFVDAAREKHPGAKIYVLGESMGGAVILSALASDNPPRADGVILVAPAVWSRSDMPLHYRMALWFAARFFPWMHVSGEGLDIWPSDNIEMLKKLSKDPLFQKKTRADAVYGLVNIMDEARHAPEKMSNPPPILFLYGGKDQIIPAAPTEAVTKALGSKAEVKRYAKGYHMLLRDLEAEVVWRDTGNWIKK